MKNVKRNNLYILLVFLLLLPLVVFYFLYPLFMRFSNDMFLNKLYRIMMEKEINFSVILNIRILLKGFLFSFFLSVLWFPPTLAVRRLYCKYILHIKDPPIF